MLLSLGILTWLEYNLRSKLADIYNACIASRACASADTEPKRFLRLFSYNRVTKCVRGHDTCSSWGVKVTNAAFALLAMLHLAYLGATFDGQEESSYTANVIAIWSSLGFYSHVIALGTLVVYVLI